MLPQTKTPTMVGVFVWGRKGWDSNPQAPCGALVFPAQSGRGEIRTHDTFRYNAFQERRFKPLTHPTALCGIAICSFASLKQIGNKTSSLPFGAPFLIFWAILKVVRTHFAAAGGEELAKNSEPKF